MTLTWEEIKANAIGFSKKWKNASSEKSMAQPFLTEFFKVFGVVDPFFIGTFENKAKKADEGTGSIDYIWKQHIAVEMKSRGLDLDKAYNQLKDYIFHLPANEIPELLMVCDFETIVLYNRITGRKTSFKTQNLFNHVRKFSKITGYEVTREIEDKMSVNIMAAEKMAALHDALKDSGYTGHSLEIYLVRLLFCLFADSADIFPTQSFLNYIENSAVNGSDLSDRIARLFEILDQSEENRSQRKMLSQELLHFNYINGKLFEERLDHADFDSKMRRLLVESANFAWKDISPAIFGAMFQGVMDKNRRRELGAHYTSGDNIKKVIKPLFVNNLWEEFHRVKHDIKKLDEFHDRLGKLTFLDPACGCGNFLIMAYQQLRMLELEILKFNSNKQGVLNIETLLRINVDQFYGIEIDEFPCQIARVGLWLMDHLMNMEVAKYLGKYYARLPLKHSATIVHANALRINWKNVIPDKKLPYTYILGNPPFNGSQTMTKAQKDDMKTVFNNDKRHNDLDYVTAWYKKTSDLMKTTDIQAAFVSTNSISQGKQAAIIWEQLFKNEIKIDFAYKDFKWDNEASGKAAVHCNIIGFSCCTNEKRKIIIDETGKSESVKNINPYLLDAPNVFIYERTKPICDAPKMEFGNMPNDKGLLSKISSELKRQILSEYPPARKWIKKFIGTEEFISDIPRWCLWLKDVAPGEINKSATVKSIIKQLKDVRLKSSRAATQKLAETPYLFGEIRQPKNKYLFIPRHSSETRKYIPMGFVDPDIIAGDSGLIIPNASLYHFGILTSIVHMAWVRVVCGRLELRYRYSKDIVYNNFPWVNVNEKQKAKIEMLAQIILDVRKKYSDESFFDLYSSSMPVDLLKAHQKVDHAVMKLYGLSVAAFSETKCVTELMKRYQILVSQF